MKRKINILTIILLMTISLPTVLGTMSGCDSETNCCEETSVPTEQEDSHDGCCVTFCFCSFSGPPSVFFNHKKEKNQTTAYTPSSDDVFIYKTPLSKNISFSVWHPPKFA